MCTDTPKGPTDTSGAAPEEQQERLRLLIELLELTEIERESRLGALEAAAPSEAAALRRMMQATLGGDDSLLPKELNPPAEGTSPDELLGRQVGSYRLAEVLGAGGMGAVFLAERTGDIEHRAAVKLLRPGLLSGRSLQRFRDEQRALATLNHANVAHFLDGGETGDGEPYLVLEYVEGTDIASYVHEQGLGQRDCVRLVLQLCAGVEAAHRALLIHADIKPANVLVRRDGTVKLLDFGVALRRPKHIADSPSDPPVRAAGLTPAWASPEQLCGEPLTVATDVYSIGAVLYRLLAGRAPVQVENPAPQTILEVIQGERPAPPTRLDPAHSGDAELDAIVLRALAPDPTERYASVHELAEDLERLLERRPVRAVGDGRLYRARRFVDRHRLTVAAGAVAVSALLISWGTALDQARRARRAASERTEQRDRAEASNEFLRGLFSASSGAGADAIRPDARVVDVLDRAVERVRADDSMATEDRLLLQATLIDLHQSMLQYDAAHDLAEATRSELEELLTRGPGEVPDHVAVAVLRAEGMARLNAGQYDLAAQRLTEALQQLEDGARDEAVTNELDPLQWSVRTELATALLQRGELDRTLEIVAPVQAELRRIDPLTLPREEAQNAAALLNLIGQTLEANQRPEEGYERMAEALRILRPWDAREAMSSLEHNLGFTALHLGRWRQAQGHLENSLELVDQLGMAPGNRALGLAALARCRAELSDGDGFRSFGSRALEDARALPEDHPWASGAQISLAQGAVALGDHETAIGHLTKALEIDQRSRPESRFIAINQLRLARSLRAVGRDGDAASAARAARQGFADPSTDGWQASQQLLDELQSNG